MQDADVATLEQDMPRFAPCCHNILSFLRHANCVAQKYYEILRERERDSLFKWVCALCVGLFAPLLLA